MRIYNITGGIGRQLAFTALLPKLVEKEKIYTLNPYPDIFQNSPYVERAIPIGMPYAWTDYVIKKENEIITPEPYFNNRFIHKECHLIEAFCEECDIEYDDSMKPEVKLPQQLYSDAERFKKENGDFIIVQFTGGQAPLGDFKNCYNPQGQIRAYPLELAQEFVNKFKSKHSDIKILNMSLPNEYKLEGTIQVAAPYLFYVALLGHCKTFIGIDSSLNHMSACVNKKGIVMWFGTSPIHFSYGHNVNLEGKCNSNDLHCSRPYVRELGDLQANGTVWNCPDPECQRINPDVIMENIENVL